MKRIFITSFLMLLGACCVSPPTQPERSRHVRCVSAGGLVLLDEEGPFKWYVCDEGHTHIQGGKFQYNTLFPMGTACVEVKP